MELISPNQTLPITIRIGMISDNEFILDSWIKIARHTYPYKYEFDFSKTFVPHVWKILDNSSILVAHLESDSDEIISYLIYTRFKNNLVVHFSYTKVDARNQNIMTRLIDFANLEHHSPVIFTHPPKNENIMIKLCKKYIYDPSIMEMLTP